MKLNLIVFIALLLSGLTILLADEKMLSLGDSERILVFDDKNSSEFYLCLMDNKKVFGKNPPKTSECYSTKEQELRVSLEAFLAQVAETESQVGFFTSEGKQVFPFWEENGFRWILQSFVISPNSKIFVQAIRKDSKQYFYWRTLTEGWEVTK